MAFKLILMMVICKALQMTPNELLSDTSDYQDKWDVDYMLVDDTSEDYILLQSISELTYNIIYTKSTD